MILAREIPEEGPRDCCRTSNHPDSEEPSCDAMDIIMSSVHAYRQMKHHV